MRVLPLALAAVLAAAPASGSGALADAERHFANRGQSSRGAECDLAEVAAALAAYRQALAADPDSLPAHVGILRGLFFRGAFCGESGEAQKRTFEEAKRHAEQAEAWLEARLQARLDRRKPERFRREAGAGPLLFWSGVAWGQWSLDHKLAAAWQGAAGRIRDLAEVAVALDPEYEQGSPHLLLGRLHTESPKIPLLTGFVSRRQGLEHLRQALALSPANSVARFFLADAMLQYEPESREDAIRLLRACASAEPRPEYLVEDRHYAEHARERLRGLDETR